MDTEYKISSGEKMTPKPPRTKEHCKHISEAHKKSGLKPPSRKGIPNSEEQKRKISASLKGKYMGANNANFGKHLTPEHRKRLSDSMKGKTISETTRKRLSIAKTGQTFTEESIQRMRDSHAGPLNNNFGKPMTESQKQKIAENHLGGFWYGNVRYYNGPQYCEKWTEDLRERVRAFFGHTCQFPGCGHVWKSGETKLAVHHVNYHKKACCSEEVIPLFVPVCWGPCHSKTNHHRAHWETIFTELIMEKFEGKCYLTKEEMQKNIQEDMAVEVNGE
jgi:hypothetical protein